MNQCGACRQDFSSLALFDAHRVGRHNLNYPEHENGRRCLYLWELEELGWAKNAQGRWTDPKRVSRAREAFARLAA